MQVQDNYIPDVAQTEDQTALEIEEQNALLDAMAATEIMQLAEAFLQSNSEYTELGNAFPSISSFRLTGCLCLSRG